MDELLGFHIPEWFAVALSLGILVLVLWRLFWKPVGRILDERQKRAEQVLVDAEMAQAERRRAEASLADMEADMDRQTAEKMQEARVKAGKEYDRIIAEAEERAKAILEAAQTRAEREREAMEVTARAEVKAAALAVAGALLEANLNAEQNERLMEAVLSQRSVSR